jgi:hypothetical protein
MELIENLAVAFATAVEANDNIYVLILCVLSLIIGVTFTVEKKIGRGSYFLYTMLIGLFLAIKNIVWVTSALALANNFLSLLVLSDILVLFIAAYFLVITAKSRSNDIYGHSRYAILAFIPIGNLWLIFGNSKDKKDTDKSLLNGVLAALIGILVLVTTIIASISINSFVVDENRMKFINDDDRKKIRNRFFSYHLHFGNITDALNYLKSLETDIIGTKIDNITIVESVEVYDDTIVYQYFITDDTINAFTQTWKDNLVNTLCTDFKQIITNNGKFLYNYRSNKVSEIENVFVDEKACGYLNQ